MQFPTLTATNDEDNKTIGQSLHATQLSVIDAELLNGQSLAFKRQIRTGDSDIKYDFLLPIQRAHCSFLYSKCHVTARLIENGMVWAKFFILGGKEEKGRVTIYLFSTIKLDHKLVEWKVILKYKILFST